MDQLDHTPFGDVDGARTDLDSFVPFTGSEWHDLALRADDGAIRVLVGAKGSGKTVYLRWLQAARADDARGHGDTYAHPVDGTGPDTTAVIRFAEARPFPLLTESWSRVWHRAILQSAASHLLRNPHLADRLAPAHREALSRYTDLGCSFARARSVYDQVKALLFAHPQAHALDRALEDPRWADLETDLASALPDVPPLFFYLDYVDDHFESAPLHWHRCQLGLFDRVMRLLRDHRFGGRLHIVTAFREIVYASALNSEHRGRYAAQPYIRVLAWTRSAARRFLEAKIRQLPESYLLNPGAPSPLQGWLGCTTVHNKRRRITEDAADYLLRHTRLLPRDVIALGNALSAAVASAKLANRSAVDPATLRLTVSKQARSFADEMLSVCAAHLAAQHLPEAAAARGYSDFYVATDEYRSTLKTDLKKFLGSIQAKDRMTPAEVDDLRERGQERFGADVDLPSALWQVGLLGYSEGPRSRPTDIFFTVTGDLDFLLPASRQGYVLHGCLIDGAGVKARGSKPVFPA